ncbi:MAG: ABC transporter permease [Flavobacteriales bacterium]|nr:ABC transporter permease [Flavobacteriales bacterium]MCB9449144.1 ABC transporter permease [Flavobacteriales bacterium]
MKVFYHLGNYCMFMGQVFKRPEKIRIYRQQIGREIDSLGLGSLGIVVLISLFMGAVITIQTASGIDSAWIPRYAIGFATRESVILELSPTIIALILAGKVGSNVASEIGTMRVSEQIDALEIMGVNSAGYLVMPKVVAAVLINPILVAISMSFAIAGGYLAGSMSNVVTGDDFIYGIQYDFDPFNVTYAFIKTVVFAFLITSISAYHGYHTRGGALEVGQSSTRAVVYSSVAILISNYVITQLLLI